MIRMEKIYRVFFCVSAILIISGIGAYCLSPAINSDMIEGVFWAEATMSGGILNSEFIYSYAIPFGSNILFIPFIILFGMTQLANSLGMLSFYLITVSTGYMFLRQLCISKEKALIGTSVLVLVYRSQIGINLLHHILFYQIGFVCYMGLTGCILHLWRLSRYPVKKRWYVFTIIFAIWSGSNGIVTILLAGFPVILSIVILILNEKISPKEFTKTMLLVLIGIIIGYLIYWISLRGIQESAYLTDAGSYVLNSTANWFEKLKEMPKIWLDSFLVSDPNKKTIYSLAGIETLISVGSAIVCASIPFVYIIRAKKLNTEELFIFCGCIVIWVVCLMQFVLTRKIAEERILYNGFFVNFILLSVLVSRYEPPKRHKIVLILLVGIVAVYSINFSVNADWSYSALKTDELEERGLSYGVASSFWDSGINTVNSKGRVKVREVIYIDGRISPRVYQAKRSWYERPSGVENWFLLLHEEEYEDLLSSPNNIVLVDSCKEVISLEGNFSNPDLSKRYAYNEYLEGQKYKALVYSIDKWEECLGLPK